MWQCEIVTWWVDDGEGGRTPHLWTVYEMDWGAEDMTEQQTFPNDPNALLVRCRIPEATVDAIEADGDYGAGAFYSSEEIVFEESE